MCPNVSHTATNMFVLVPRKSFSHKTLDLFKIAILGVLLGAEGQYLNRVYGLYLGYHDAQLFLHFSCIIPDSFGHHRRLQRIISRGGQVGRYLAVLDSPPK